MLGLLLQVIFQVFYGLDFKLQLSQILLVIEAVLIFLREGRGQVRQNVRLLFQIFNGEVIFLHLLTDDVQAISDELVRLCAALVLFLQGRLIVKMDDAVQNILRLHRIIAAHGNVDQIILSARLSDGQAASQPHRRILHGSSPDNHGNVQAAFVKLGSFLHDEGLGVKPDFLAEDARLMPVMILLILFQAEFRSGNGNHQEPGVSRFSLLRELRRNRGVLINFHLPEPVLLPVGDVQLQIPDYRFQQGMGGKQENFIVQIGGARVDYSVGGGQHRGGHGFPGVIILDEDGGGLSVHLGLPRRVQIGQGQANAKGKHAPVPFPDNPAHDGPGAGKQGYRRGAAGIQGFLLGGEVFHGIKCRRPE